MDKKKRFLKRISKDKKPAGKKSGKLKMFALKTLFTIPLALFALWLISLVYLPSPDAKKTTAPIQTTPGEEGIFQQIIEKKETPASAHFHMVDEAKESVTEPFQPLCITCHGTLPHTKEQKLRSLLNFHTGYMACTVCHVRKDPADHDMKFIWVDRKSGLMSSSVEGSFGQYPAKIFPVKVSANGRQTIYHPVSEKAAEEFLKLKDRFTPDQMSQAKIKLHERITPKPVLCKECHTKKGYFDFKHLGYPQNRIDHLISSEVVGMIDKYETFYLPEAIDFGAE